MIDDGERVQRVYVDRNLVPEGKRDQIEEERKQIEKDSGGAKTPLKEFRQGGLLTRAEILDAAKEAALKQIQVRGAAAVLPPEDEREGRSFYVVDIDPFNDKVHGLGRHDFPKVDKRLESNRKKMANNMPSGPGPVPVTPNPGVYLPDSRIIR